MKPQKKTFLLSLCFTFFLGGDALAATPWESAQKTSKSVATALLAEIALQRNLFGDAYVAYMKAAEMSKDASLAKKAYDIALRANDNKKLADSLQLLNRLDPKNDVALLNAIHSFIAKENWQEALNTFKKALSHTKSSLDFTKALENKTQRNKNKVKRYELFSHALLDQNEKTRKADFDLILARLAKEANKKDIALKWVDVAYEKDSHNATLLLAGADVDYSLRPQATKKRIRTYLAQKPRDIRVRVALAKCEVRDKNIKGALAELKTMTTLLPDDPQALFLAGNVAEEARAFKEAKGYYNAYLKIAHIDPRYIEDAAWVRLGVIAMNENHVEDAIDYFHKVTKGEYVAAAHQQEAQLLDYIGKADAACDVYRSIPTKNVSQKAEFLNGCSHALVRAKRPHSALSTLEEALDLIEKKPSQAPHLFYEAGILATNIKDYTKAEKYLKTYIRLMPRDAQGFNSLGYMLLDEKKDVKASRPYIVKAMELSGGKDSYIVDSLGWLLFKEGQLKEAKEKILASLALREDAEVRLHLIEVLIELKEFDAAQKDIDALLSANPSHKKALEFKERIKRLKEEFKK